MVPSNPFPAAQLAGASAYATAIAVGGPSAAPAATAAAAAAEQAVAAASFQALTGGALPEGMTGDPMAAARAAVAAAAGITTSGIVGATGGVGTGVSPAAPAPAPVRFYMGHISVGTHIPVLFDTILLRGIYCNA